VGAWDAGPFDNDDAADFAIELDDADPAERLMLLREAIQEALDPTDESDERLTQNRAVAAAAVIAASQAGAAPISSSDAPKFLTVGEALTVPSDLVGLTVLALDRMADSESETAQQFAEAGTLDSLRDTLAP
jgi:hypothetical protein